MSRESSGFWIGWSQLISADINWSQLIRIVGNFEIRMWCYKFDPKRNADEPHAKYQGPPRPPTASGVPRLRSKESGHDWILNWIFTQTSRGSFSAVSTPIFASKYSLESSRRDLHNALLCTVLRSQNFSQKSSTFFRRGDWIIEFPFFSISSSNFAFFLRTFDKKISGFRAKFQRRVTSVAFQSILRNKLENCRKLIQNSEICENYSILDPNSILFNINH